MTRLLRKLAQMSLVEDLATGAWRDVSDAALQRSGPSIYSRELVPGFEETRGERLLLLPSKELYAEQVSRGELPHYQSESEVDQARDTALDVRRTAKFLNKLSAALISVEADDGDVYPYETETGNTMARDYSAQRDHDITSGLEDAWDANDVWTTDEMSTTPPTSGENPVLQQAPQHQKYAGTRVRDHAHLAELAHAFAARIKWARADTYPNNAAGHAELTDDQQERKISDAFDSLAFHAPHSAEGDPVFTWSEQEKSAQGPDFTPEAPIEEDEEARGLPQWPRMLRDSRGAGEGDTSLAWAEHDSFDITDMPSVDSQGNPGPSA